MPIVNGAIDFIAEGEELNHEGDLVIKCDVPASTKVTVKNGTLIIDGDVGEEAIIKLEATRPQASIKTTVSGVSGSSVIIVNGSGNKINGITIPNSGTPGIVKFSGSSYNKHSHTLTIHGEIKARANIQADYNINCQNIAEDCSIKANGNIECGNVGANSKITTHNSNIIAQNVDESAFLATSNGYIKVANVAEGANLTTSNGCIVARDIGEKAKLNTTNAFIKAANIKDQAELITRNENIFVSSIEGNPTLATTNGQIVTCKVKQQLESSKRAPKRARNALD